MNNMNDAFRVVVGLLTGRNTQQTFSERGKALDHYAIMANKASLGKDIEYVLLYENGNIIDSWGT